MTDTQAPVARAEPPPEIVASIAQRHPQQGPVPVMEAPPEGAVTLPGGWFDARGALRRDAVVRELTGEDEEALASFDPARNIAQFITAFVSRGVISVGGQPMDAEMARALLMGDRAFLMLKIREISLGREVEMKVTCNVCGTATDVAFELDVDIPIKLLSSPAPLYDVELRHGSARVALPTGLVHEHCLMDNLNAAATNTRMIYLCLKELSDSSQITEQTVRSMGLMDRRTLLTFLVEHQPGPDWENVQAPCQQCGKSYPVNLGLEGIFRW